MSDEICSVHGGPPQHAIGLNLPLVTRSANGFVLCGACAAKSLSPSGTGASGRIQAKPATGKTFAEEVAEVVHQLYTGGKAASSAPRAVAPSEPAAENEDPFFVACADAVAKLHAEGFDANAPSSVHVVPFNRSA